MALQGLTADISAPARGRRTSFTVIPEVDSGLEHRQERMRIDARTRAVQRRIRQIGRLQMRLRRASAALGDDVEALRRLAHG